MKPVFQKARPVPYALLPAVEKKLKKMEGERIIEPVEVSNWATPIVCVPKTDSSVRVSGDYSGDCPPRHSNGAVSYSDAREDTGKSVHLEKVH